MRLANGWAHNRGIIGRQNEPGTVTVDTSAQLAEIRAAVNGELRTYGHGTVLAILAVSTVLVAANLLALVIMRRKDFGRRRALGATRGLIIALVIGQVAVPAVAGAVAGTGWPPPATLCRTPASPPRWASPGCWWPSPPQLCRRWSPPGATPRMSSACRRPAHHGCGTWFAQHDGQKPCRDQRQDAGARRYDSGRAAQAEPVRTLSPTRGNSQSDAAAMVSRKSWSRSARQLVTQALQWPGASPSPRSADRRPPT